MNARNVKHRVGVLLIWEQPKDEPRLVHYKVLKQMLECIAKYRNKECLCHTDTRNVQHSKTSMCAMRKKKRESSGSAIPSTVLPTGTPSVVYALT